MLQHGDISSSTSTGFQSLGLFNWATEPKHCSCAWPSRLY